MQPFSISSQTPLESHFSQFKERDQSLEVSLELQRLLINRKTEKLQQIQSRMHQRHILYRQMFKSNKICLVGNRRNIKKDDNRENSNLETLKRHAQMLMDEDIKMLGKENGQQIKAYDSVHEIKQTNNQINRHYISTRNQVSKKMNKRRILKGRPDIYAVIKKRNIWNEHNEEEVSINFIAKIKEPLKDISNKIPLINYTNSKPKEKTKAELIIEEWEESKKRTTLKKKNLRRSSLATLTNYQNSLYIQKGQINSVQLINEREMCYAEKYPIKNRRYISANTND